MRRVLIGAMALTMLLLSAAPGLANNTWGEYHWDGTGTPVSLSVEDNLSFDWTADLVSVESDWDSSGALNLHIGVPDGSNICLNPLGNNAPSGGNLIEVCNGSYGTNGWLGVAQIWINGTHIVGAVAAVNDSYLGPNGAYYNANARRHVLCQEIGHAFGLGHQGSPKKKSCMNDRWGLTSSGFVSPNQHDYKTLDKIYAHLDGITDDGGGKGGPSCDKKPDHPKCQAGSPGQSFEVKRLSNGQTLLTWITWAPGYGPSRWATSR